MTKQVFNVEHMNIVLDYIKVGDALGMGYEYTPQSFIDSNFNPLDLKYIQHPHWKNLKPGMYTDDSQMSMAVVRLMAERPQEDWFDDRVVASYFLNEFKADPREGYSTGLYGVLKKSRDWVEFLSLLSTHEKSDKNGGCMRAIPVGLLSDISLVKRFSRFQAEVTHRGTGVDAAELIALAAYFAYNKLGAPKDIFKWLEATSSYYPDILRFKLLRRVDGKKNLGLKTALTAIRIFKNSKLWEDGIAMAIKIGGDTDTVAALVSGLYGCYEVTSPSVPTYKLQAFAELLRNVK
jgi:ADP-ribosyl-[dinitrogen reductase] hydrolase